MNIRAISVADTSDISTVRFVVDDPEKAKNILIGRRLQPQGDGRARRGDPRPSRAA